MSWSCDRQGFFKDGVTDLTLHMVIWAVTPEILSLEFANNKGADKPAHPCRLISAFVI